MGTVAAPLAVTAGADKFRRKYPFGRTSALRFYQIETASLVVWITPQVADRLLAIADSSLVQLDALAGRLAERARRVPHPF